MKRQLIVCPHCGKLVKLNIKKGVVEIDDSITDIDTSALLKKLKEAGVELASVKGGDMDG